MWVVCPCVWLFGFLFFWIVFVFCFKQKTAYELRISDWSSDVCSSDLSGSPPGSADRPSGERFGPISAAAPPAPKRAARSLHGNWLNCTPNRGPLSSPAVVGAGGKCSCTIMLAVRVATALPPLDRYAPVRALAIAPAPHGPGQFFASLLSPLRPGEGDAGGPPPATPNK